MTQMGFKQTPSTGLVVRFAGCIPDEELVYWAHRCAQRCGELVPLTVVVSRAEGARAMTEVRLERRSRVLVYEQDPNPMLAIRNAFERLPAVVREGAAS